MTSAFPRRLASRATRRTGWNCARTSGSAWAAIACILLIATETDPDLWGHLRFGLDWWRTGTLPSVDPYSFTQDRPWVNHEWLSEAAMAGAYRLAGTKGLIALKIAILGSVLTLLGRRLRGSTPIVSASVLALAVVCLLPISLTVRPHLWSACALALLITLLDRPTPPDWRRVVATMLLFGFWANLHGGWITGAAVLCVYALVRACRERKAIRRWIAIVGLSLAATLVNPYGPGLWEFLIRTVRSSRPDITEWQPLSLTLPPSPDWIGVIAPIAIAVALSARKFNRLPLETWAALLLLVAAAVRVSRVGPLMVPACLLLLAPHISGQWGQVGRVAVRRGGASVVFWIPVLVVVAAAGRSTVTALACVPDRGAWIPDREAAARLEGASGRLWTTFNWGE